MARFMVKGSRREELVEFELVQNDTYIELKANGETILDILPDGTLSAMLVSKKLQDLGIQVDPEDDYVKVIR